MDVTFTDRAIAILHECPQFEEDLLFRLMYDPEGCGCVNDGVIHLMQIAEPEKEDIEITANRYKCYVSSAYQVYFDDHLTIDYSTTYNMFQLKSHERMMNPRMSFISSSSKA